MIGFSREPKGQAILNGSRDSVQIRFTYILQTCRGKRRNRPRSTQENLTRHWRDFNVAIRPELLSKLKKQYKEASGAEKKIILDAFVVITDYHRKHAIRVLRKNGSPAPCVGGRRHWRRYGLPVKTALVALWEASGGICGKRLKRLIPTLLRVIECGVKFRLDDTDRTLVLRVSASTIDRLLADARLAQWKARSPVQGSDTASKLATAWRMTEVPQRRSYVRTKPPSAKPMIFDSVRAELDSVLRANPTLNAVALLSTMRCRYPGRFDDVSLRTMQRERNRWRERVAKRIVNEKAAPELNRSETVRPRESELNRNRPHAVSGSTPT